LAAAEIRRSLTRVTTEIAVSPPPATFFRRNRWRIALHYKEKRGIPSSCFGDTNCFISDMRVLGP
jgi:hypothetical protein